MFVSGGKGTLKSSKCENFQGFYLTTIHFSVIPLGMK